MAEPAEGLPGAEFEDFRSLLFGVAYRMLGSATDAEDAVQETWLRWNAAGGIREPRAWLIRVVTNICLDELRSARVRREQYVGPWLPEPILTGADDDDPFAAVQHRDLIPLGALQILERPSPASGQAQSGPARSRRGRLGHPARLGVVHGLGYWKTHRDGTLSEAKLLAIPVCGIPKSSPTWSVRSSPTPMG